MVNDTTLRVLFLIVLTTASFVPEDLFLEFEDRITGIHSRTSEGE